MKKEVTRQERINASAKVSQAVRSGKIKKPKGCLVCGDSHRIIGHHFDYKKPLKVIWFCAKCHSRWHAIISKNKGKELEEKLKWAYREFISDYRFTQKVVGAVFNSLT